MAYNQVLVNNFGNSSLPDTQEAFQLGGKQGEGLVSEIHGKWYTAAYRGNVFHATSPIAGQVIPVITSTTSQTALSLYNPLGSGKNLELISFRLGQSITTATCDVGSATPLPTFWRTPKPIESPPPSLGHRSAPMRQARRGRRSPPAPPSRRRRSSISVSASA